IKTLRHYDETGLLRPAHIDPENWYRYYLASQLSQLHRILALKDFGFSLEQIAEALKAGITAEQMRGCCICGRRNSGSASRRRVIASAD
ncbi:MAG: MerR family transcriptional regulator, partial [Silvibacterium sp.]